MLAVTAASGFGSRSPTPFKALGVEFDGSNDYMLRGGALTGIADSDDWLISCWLKPTSTDYGVVWGTNAVGDKPATLKVASQKFVVQNYLNASNYFYAQVDTVIGTGTWHHLLIQTGSSPHAGKAYFDDTDSYAVNASSGSSFTSNNTGTNFAIGSNTNGGELLTSAIAELFIIFGSTLDISVTANRRLFIDADGQPVDLGTDGSTPTGSAPDVYQSVRTGDSAADFATNRGAGGNFTITGSLVLSSSNPGD